MTEKTHLEYLQEWRPDILKGRILDLGSGRGDFLIDVVRNSGNIVGVETSKEYIQISHEKAKEAGVVLEIINGSGENLPFDDNIFEFVNLAEVIEHVREPEQVLKQVYRVLKRGGQAYMSVPNRFGFKDQHFKLYFVNWLPRYLAPRFIGLFGKHKDYVDACQRGIGFQKLNEMHYYTYGGIKKICQNVGFKTTDIREQKIKKLYPSNTKYLFFLVLYKLAKLFYFNSFHLQLIK